MHALYTSIALLSLSPAVLAQPEDDALSCRAPGDTELAIEGAVQPRCEMLFGGEVERRRNQRWRQRRLYAVEVSGATIDVTHGDPSMDTTRVQSLPGMTVLETFSVELVERECAAPSDDDDGEPLGEEAGYDEELPEQTRTTHEYVALVSLGEAWSQVCPGETALLRVDDALGASGRVIWIGDSGVLAYLSDGLTWVPRAGFEAPSFRNIWRSEFSVLMGGDTVGKKPPARRPPPRRVNRRPVRRR